MYDDNGNNEQRFHDKVQYNINYRNLFVYLTLSNIIFAIDRNNFIF
jgi:hypothetical protein